MALVVVNAIQEFDFIPDIVFLTRHLSSEGGGRKSVSTNTWSERSICYFR